MRYDEKFKNQPQDGQMCLELEDDKATSDFEESMAWIVANQDTWHFMTTYALGKSRRRGRVAIKQVVEEARDCCRTSIKNALSPYFARWMVAEYPELKHTMKLNKSEADGFEYDMRRLVKKGYVIWN